ncbi:MAG TPA: hypothetical protein VML96_03735 [Egibacteraceae bacterium]|nr:hypothetical protein [Egibacteraceae bacterium]
MDGPERGRRRIDRILAHTFLADLDSKTASEVRAMRDDCRQEEGRLSYARRLLQARLDIVAAETARRASDGAGGGLLDALPSILAGPAGQSRQEGRPVTLYAPADDDGRREEDAALDDPSLSNLADMDAAALERFQQRLAEEERETSRIRSLVQERLDLLQGELVRRYRDGEAAVDQIVGVSRSRSADEGPSAG